MIRINQVKMKCEHTREQLIQKVADILRVSKQEILEFDIIRQSIDARKKPEIFYSYTVEISVNKEDKVLATALKKKAIKEQIQKSDRVVYRFPVVEKSVNHEPIVIVGAGPAGLFCAYFLTLHGYKTILLERGKDVDARQKDVEEFWGTGKLHPNSNVQFGEGGAGTFSDGKLNTLVKDKEGRNRAVLETFVKFGAKESIIYDAKPHIGTDILCEVIKNMRKEIIRLGGEVRFESQVTDIFTENTGNDGENGLRHITGVVVNGQETLSCSRLVLAIGHSARDTFSMLYDKKIPMEAKAFAVGFRVEHPQEMINESQYGVKNHNILGAAPYKLAAKASNGRGVYSFCMCPGGYVVNASSEEGRLAVNGMSYSRRNGKNANSAIIVSVTPEDFGDTHPLSGIAFQRMLEQKAYHLAKGKIPVQRYGEFKMRVLQEQKNSREISPLDRIQTISRDEQLLQPNCKGSYQWSDVSTILPKECNKAFVEGMESFGRQIKGFNRPDAILLGVESRTSSPVRIHRDKDMQSVIKGLYPCGEGAGYAGGITSAAMDGMRVAEAIAKEFM